MPPQRAPHDGGAAVMTTPASRAEMTIAGRRLTLSNLDKVLWPRLGLTKAWLIEYYTEIAPALLPHLSRHPVTLHRFPDGVDGVHWFETRAPKARPSWVETVTFDMERTGKVFRVCLLDDVASLMWAAQFGTVELHPYLGTAEALDAPQFVVFDLDPGAPATIVDACRVAIWLRDVLEAAGLESWPKTSGGVGLHVYVPLNTPVTYSQTKTFAHAVARLLEQAHPEAVVSVMTKARRDGKVFIDWSQNDKGKSTIVPYSLRGFAFPTVSTPVGWDEVIETIASADPRQVTFLADDALRRARSGDVFSPVLTTCQRLPREHDRRLAAV
ncbi:MAG: non-homologous end-joining DNA ligase [Candidatus Dormibacteria bacterium]